MKYIKLYEGMFEEETFKEWMERKLINPSAIGIDCHHEKITDLKGIEKFINLETLQCSENKLVSLEGIENLTRIRIMAFDNNQITTLKPMRNLVNLSGMNCSNNRLKSLEFGNYSIEALELGIDVTDLSKFKGLRLLMCSDNQFSDRYKNYIKKYCREERIFETVD